MNYVAVAVLAFALVIEWPQIEGKYCRDRAGSGPGQECLEICSDHTYTLKYSTYKSVYRIECGIWHLRGDTLLLNDSRGHRDTLVLDGDQLLPFRRSKQFGGMPFRKR